jgi:ribosomal protein S18 acetylase RimI-like enzyme
MDIHVREAGPGDEAAVAALIQELAAESGETSPVTEDYAGEYLATPGSHVLLARGAARIVGLLSYSVRPNLYHAGPAACIEELVVTGPERGRGVGSALLRHLLAHLEATGCVEVSVTALPDNEGAQRLWWTRPCFWRNTWTDSLKWRPWRGLSGEEDREGRAANLCPEL